MKVHNPVSDVISTFETHPSIIKIQSDLIRSNNLFDFKKTSFEEIVTEISKLKFKLCCWFRWFPRKNIKTLLSQISVLPVVSKVFERIMLKQINTYFQGKLSPLLGGYKKGFQLPTFIIKNY